MSARNAQIWIPSVFAIDRPLMGEMSALSGAPYPVGPTARSTEDDPVWIADHYSVHQSDIETFLEDISPALTALLLAGYRVPFVDIVFPDPISPQPFHESVFFDSFGSGQGLRAYWLRLDLTTRRISMLERVIDPDVKFGVRLEIDPISSQGVLTTLPLPLTSLAAVTDTAPEEVYTRAFYTAEFGEDVGAIEYERIPGDTDPLLPDLRYHSMLPLVAAFASGATSVVIPCHVIPEVARADPFSIDAPENPRLCLSVLKSFIFDSITWWVGEALITAVEDWQVAPPPPAGQLPGRAPGFVWALNPATWENVFYMPDGSDTWNPLGLLSKAAEIAWEMLSWPGPAHWDPHRHHPDALTALAFDPGMAGLRARFGVADPVAAPNVTAARFMISAWLIGPNLLPAPESIPPFSFFHVLAEEPVWDDPNASPDTPWSRRNMEWLQSWNYVRSVRQALRSIHGNDLKAREQSEIAQAVKVAPYPVGIFAMLNLGVLSLEGQVNGPGEGILTAQITPYKIPGEDFAVALNHSFSADSRIILRQKHFRDHPLLESVVWEYIPASDMLTPDQIALISQVNPEIKDVIAQGQDRLVIVAAPGIEIVEEFAFPNNCKLDIYRVQSVALVPEPGTPITTKILETPYSVSIYDDLLHWDDPTNAPIAVFDPAQPAPPPAPGTPPDGPTNIPTLQAFRESTRDDTSKAPYMAVKPWRNADYCGVEITYEGHAGSYRGVSSRSKVRIYVSNLSGDDRFSFDFRYKIQWREGAVVGHGTQILADGRTIYVPIYDDVSTLQFGLVIHGTNHAIVKVNDYDVGGPFWEYMRDVLDWSEVETAVMYSFWKGQIASIPPQGVSLEKINTAQDPDAPATMPVTLPGATQSYDMIENLYPVQAATRDASIGEAQMFVDMAVGFIPLVGDAMDVIELSMSFVTGLDKWGKPMTNGQRLLIAGAALLPVISPRILRAFKGPITADIPPPPEGFLDDFLDTRGGI